jgi:hypothetical protein
LITFLKHPHPEKMDMIRHATVNWAAEAIPKYGVRQDLTKFVVENWNEPALLAVFYSHRPMYDGVSAVCCWIESGQIVVPPWIHRCSQASMTLDCIEYDIKLEASKVLQLWLRMPM